MVAAGAPNTGKRADCFARLPLLPETRSGARKRAVADPRPPSATRRLTSTMLTLFLQPVLYEWTQGKGTPRSAESADESAIRSV